jgi:uncharacterized protein (DUF488 family)
VKIWSVGHGARSLEELVETLRGIECVADVRAHPGSRRHPHFGKEALERSLPPAGIDYHWLPALGGRRKLKKDSPNPAWQIVGFRAYADYTDTPEFARGLDSLLALAAARPTAFMCAESHWSQCHRRILADKLWSLGHEVVHLISPSRSEPHHPPPFLRVDGEHLRYDVGQLPLL